jgi:hypothetical protein
VTPPIELNTGPPGPDMLRPGGKTWPTRECRFSEPTIDLYTSGSQTSSDILRMACAALSAEELEEWLICRHVVYRGEDRSRKGATCH